jgi:hypothetical protein
VCSAIRAFRAPISSPHASEKRPLWAASTESGGKDRTEGVAYRLEDETTVPFYGLPEQGVVTGQGDLHASRVLLPQLRRTLYVRKE